MAASQSRTVHSKTHRVCPIHTSNIGPIGPISSTIPSPWIESLPKDRSHMLCIFQRATVPRKWLRPNHVRYIPRPTGSVLSTQEILDSFVHYPVVYHHLESSPYTKAGLKCYAWFKELLYEENGCVPITYSTYQTHRVCPIHTRNIGPIGPISSTIPSPWIESLPKGRSHMLCIFQRATVPGKWLRPNHVRYIPRPTGSVLSTQEILDSSVHYPVVYHHIESSPKPKAGQICRAWLKELLYRENGCVPITYGTFQDPQGLSYPHKKYWTHRSNIQYYTITLHWVLTQRRVWYAKHDFKELLYQKNGCVPITYGTFQDPQGLSYPHKKYWTYRSNIQYYTIALNWVLTQRQVSFAMHDSKSYCTRKMAASQSRTVHSKTHRVCLIHRRNIGPIGPLSSTIPSPWIESLPKGRTPMPCMIRRATVPGKWLRPNHVQCIPRHTGSVLSTQEILDPSV